MVLFCRIYCHLLLLCTVGSLGDELCRGAASGWSDVGHCSVCTDVREPGQCHRGSVCECSFAGAVLQCHTELQHRYERHWHPQPAQLHHLRALLLDLMSCKLTQGFVGCPREADFGTSPPEIFVLAYALGFWDADATLHQRKAWLPAGILPASLAGGLGTVKALLVCREAELCIGGLAKQTGRSRCLEEQESSPDGSLEPPEDRSKEPQEYLIPV